MTRRGLEPERVDPGAAGEGVGRAALVGQHQRDDRALLAGAGRAAAPVQVALVVLRRVHVQHQADVVHVDAARRDVGADEHVDGALAELGEDAGALVLALAAVQAARLDADPGQLLAQPVHAVLGADEDDRTALAVGDLGRDVELVVARHLHHVVLHGVDRRGRRSHGVGDRVLEEAVHQLVDVAVERGREQQPLAVGRGLREQFGDDGEEAEVAHVVGLVEDTDLDIAQRALTLADEVTQAAGGGDHDVDAAAQRLDLLAHGHAADDDLHAQAEAAPEGFEGVVHLEGELAGGHEDHRVRPPGGGSHTGDARHGGQAEGEGLARAGLAAPEDVVAGEHVGDRRALDGERAVEAQLGQSVDERLGQAKQLELGRARLPSVGLGVRLRGGFAERGHDSVKHGHEIRAFPSKWRVTSAKGRAGTCGLWPHTFKGARHEGGMKMRGDTGAPAAGDA